MSLMAISATLHVTLFGSEAIFHSSQQTEQCAVSEMLKLYSNSLFVGETTRQDYIRINALRHSCLLCISLSPLMCECTISAPYKSMY